MAKTDWQLEDTVLPQDMNDIGHEINKNTADIGDMSTVPTTAKDAAGAITELHQAIQDIDVSIPDGSITPAKLSFDPATQSDIIALINDIAGKLDKSGGQLTGIVTSLTGITQRGIAMPNSTNPVDDLAGIGDLQFYCGEVNNVTGYPSSYGSLIGYKRSSNGHAFSWQIFVGYNTAHLYWRKGDGSDGWTPWKKLWDSSNQGSGSGLNADMLDGKHDWQFVNSIASGSSADPNTTQEAYILTNHANSPDTSIYWHIQTFFYAGLEGNRAQQAISYYGPRPRMFIRHMYVGTWSNWVELTSGGGKSMYRTFITAPPDTTYHYNGPSGVYHPVLDVYGQGYFDFVSISGSSTNGSNTFRLTIDGVVIGEFSPSTAIFLITAQAHAKAASSTSVTYPGVTTVDHITTVDPYYAAPSNPPIVGSGSKNTGLIFPGDAVYFNSRFLLEVKNPNSTGWQGKIRYMGAKM